MKTGKRTWKVPGLLLVLHLVLIAVAGHGSPAAAQEGETGEPVPVQIAVDPVPETGAAPYRIDLEQTVAPRPAVATRQRATTPGNTGFVRLKTLIVIYPDTHTGTLPAADVDKVKQQVRDAAAFYWRHSHMKLHLDLTYMVIDTFKDESEYATLYGGCRWLMPYDNDGDGQSVENDLLARGVQPGDYDSINLIWSYADGKLPICAWGLTWMPAYHWPTLGDVGFTTDAVLNIFGAPAQPFNHEFQHTIDGFFATVGDPEYFGADYPEGEPGRFGENWDFHRVQMENWPVEDWFDLLGAWGSYGEAVDADGDGVPDEAADLYITEKTMGSLPTQTDSDGDGVSDMAEAMAGIHRGSDAMRKDSDGDGEADGVDEEPLYVAQLQTPHGSPALDGRLDGWSPFTAEMVQSTAPGFAAPLYLNWDENYLYIALEMNRRTRALLKLDAGGDGWFKGANNYFLELRPYLPADSVVGAAAVIDCSLRYSNRCVWDTSSGYPEPRLVVEADIERAVTAQGSGFLLQLAIPANARTGLVPRHGFRVGVNTFYEYIEGRGDWHATNFEENVFLYPALWREDSHEPNDTAAAATAAVYGDRLLATLDSSDVDYYRFEAEAGDHVVIKAADPAGVGVPLAVALLDETGAIVAEEGFAEPRDVWLTATMPDAGAAYVRVVMGASEPAAEQPGDVEYALTLDTGVLVSPNRSGKLGALDYAANDILIHYDQRDEWETFFDGSDVDISGNVTAFAVLPGGELLLALDQTTLHEPAGFVKPQDIALFKSSALGETTAGIFDMFFDGSGVGLDTADEAIDAIAVYKGRLFLSTTGPAQVGSGDGSVQAGPEDLLQFHASRLSWQTAGSWSLYLDGSEVGLPTNVSSAWLDGHTGDVYLTLPEAATVSGLAVTPQDVLHCARAGDPASCTWRIDWAGAPHHLSGFGIDGLSLGQGQKPGEGGSITIRAEVQGQADGVFLYTGDLGPLSVRFGQQRSYTLLPAGSYAVRQRPEPDWRVAAITCDDPDGATTVDVAGGTATITLEPAEAVVCTFTSRPNGKPSATADSYQVPPGKTLVILEPGVLENDRDPEEDCLSASLITDVQHGTLALKPDGGFVYTPEEGFAGVDTFSYAAYDGLATSAPVPVPIRVGAEIFLPATMAD